MTRTITSPTGATRYACIVCSVSHDTPLYAATCCGIAKTAQAQAQASAAPRSEQIGGDHYAKHTIQPWDAMAEWLGPDGFAAYLRGNAIKYLARCNDKGGIEDVRKAQHYLDKLIEVMGATGEAK